MSDRAPRAAPVTALFAAPPGGHIQSRTLETPCPRFLRTTEKSRQHRSKPANPENRVLRPSELSKTSLNCGILSALECPCRMCIPSRFDSQNGNSTMYGTHRKPTRLVWLVPVPTYIWHGQFQPCIIVLNWPAGECNVYIGVAATHPDRAQESSSTAR